MVNVCIKNTSCICTYKRWYFKVCNANSDLSISEENSVFDLIFITQTVFISQIFNKALKTYFIC